MSEERRIYDPTTAPRWTPQKDWVALTDGASVCVWELSVAEQFQVAEAAQRHPQDPRPGSNEQEAALWLIAYAARAGSRPDSPRIWGDMAVYQILDLSPDNFSRLLIAARGLLNGTEEEEERQRNFTPEPATGRPVSPTGASNTSTDCRPS